MSDKRKKLCAAYAAMKRAGKAVDAATAAAFPVGRVVCVTLSGRPVRGPVVMHLECWWNPGWVQMKNEETGKLRWFFGPTHKGDS